MRTKTLYAFSFALALLNVSAVSAEVYLCDGKWTTKECSNPEKRASELRGISRSELTPMTTTTGSEAAPATGEGRPSMSREVAVKPTEQRVQQLDLYRELEELDSEARALRRNCPKSSFQAGTECYSERIRLQNRLFLTCTRRDLPILESKATSRCDSIKKLIDGTR